MVKAAFIVLLSVIAIGPSFNGCKDLSRSLGHIVYPPVRDMRHSMVLAPQKVRTVAPDSLSVPTVGREFMRDRTAFEAQVREAFPSDEASVTRGATKFQKTCIPCHGTSLKGDGPVAAKFIPPPDLLAAGTRGRTDGYIYTYIRHGGAVMPSYGAQVTASEAWDLIHYIRDQQKKNPR